MADFDLAVIGGGINGTGIARDAAGRGISVLLVEMRDLGSGTSSASSKLIHGGLRYLEHGAFRWPPISDGVMRLSASQLAALVDGLDWVRLHAVDIPRPTATS